MSETSEIKKEPVQAPALNKREFINGLVNSFASTIRKIYVNGLKKEVGFREITVLEQKQMSRIMIDNEQRKDVIYDSQCALINKVCLDPEFDVYNCTEFDKIKLLMALYQTNMFKNDIHFKCEACGTENVYKLDFSRVLERLDGFDLSETAYDFENDNWKFNFKIGYPSVKRVSEFYRMFGQKYKNARPKELETINSMVNMDYVNTFVKSIRLENKQTGAVQDIDFSQFSVSEMEEIFAAFPQDVLYTDDGVLNYIANEYIKKINDTFDQHKCGACGAIYEEAIDKDTQSFF